MVTITLYAGQKKRQRCIVMSNSLQSCGLLPARILCPGDFLGKNTEIGCHFPLQGIFWTQELNSCLLHCRQILYHLSHQGSPLVTIPLLSYIFAFTLQSTWNIILQVFRCYTVFCKKYFINFLKIFW